MKVLIKLINQILRFTPNLFEVGNRIFPTGRMLCPPFLSELERYATFDNIEQFK